MMSMATNGPGPAQYAVPDGPKIPQPRNTQTPSDWDEVRQYEPETDVGLRTVPVRIEGFPTVYALPAKSSSMYSVTYDQLAFINNPNEVVPANPKIKQAWITASGTNAVIGTREQIMKTGAPTGFPMPQNQPLRWEGFSEALYAVATSAGSGTISVRLEFWAD